MTRYNDATCTCSNAGCESSELFTWITAESWRREFFTDICLDHSDIQKQADALQKAVEDAVSGFYENPTQEGVAMLHNVGTLGRVDFLRVANRLVLGD